MSRVRLHRMQGDLEIAYVEAQIVMDERVVDELEIIHIEVLPAHRRQGLGRALLDELLATHQPRKVFLEVRQSNAPAIGLYEKLGFKPIGVRKAYYRDPVEDAVMMRLGATPLSLCDISATA